MKNRPTRMVEFVRAMRRRGRVHSFYSSFVSAPNISPEQNQARSKVGGARGTAARMSNQSMKKGI